MSIEVWLGGSTGKISPELKAVNSFEKHIHDIDYEITGMTDKNMEVFIGRLLRSANKRFNLNNIGRPFTYFVNGLPIVSYWQTVRSANNLLLADRNSLPITPII